MLFLTKLIPVHIAFPSPILIPALLKKSIKLSWKWIGNLSHDYYIWIDYSYMWIPQDRKNLSLTYYKNNAAQTGLTIDVTLFPKAMNYSSNWYDYLDYV